MKTAQGETAGMINAARTMPAMRIGSEADLNAVLHSARTARVQRRPAPGRCGPNDILWYPPGCDHCDQTGYVSRAMAYELIAVDRINANQIAHGVTTEELRQLAVDSRMRSLTRHALEMVQASTTSLEEAYRVRLEDLDGSGTESH